MVPNTCQISYIHHDGNQGDAAKKPSAVRFLWKCLATTAWSTHHRGHRAPFLVFHLWDDESDRLPAIPTMLTQANHQLPLL